MPTRSRIFYLDTLRVALTILVIAHHVGQAYGPTGGFWPVQEAQRAPILGAFFTVNRSFFMSLFFLISGYFMIGAYERNSPGAFIRSRLLRLGLPVLVSATLMIPARIFLFGEHITRWGDLFNAMHLWYLEHVLLFSLVYALWRAVRGNRVDGQATGVSRKAPGLLPTLACVLGVAVLFREAFNGQSALGKSLAANQYSAYFWHPLLVVGIQICVLALPLGPFAKFVLVTLVGVPLVFLWSALMRRLSWVRAVL